MTLTIEYLRKHVETNRTRVEAEAKRISNLIKQQFASLGLADNLSDMSLVDASSMGETILDDLRGIIPDWDVAWVVASERGWVNGGYGDYFYYEYTLAIEAAHLIEMNAQGHLVFVQGRSTQPPTN